MKAKNLNNSSKKTRAIIKSTFAEMLSEKKEISKISVTELVKRADINRGTFYSHYDDIYSVAEDFENELIDQFYSNIKLVSCLTFEELIDQFFEFITANNENYRLICKSNDVAFASKKLTSLVESKLLEICNNDPHLVDRSNLELEINVFVEGLLCEYVKYCRGYSTNTIDDLHNYVKYWFKSFKARRFK